MTNTEWIRQALSHTDVKVPYRFSLTPRAKKIVERHFCTQFENNLNIPIRTISPMSVKPAYADPSVYGDTVTDEFGVVWSTSDIDRGYQSVTACRMLIFPDIPSLIRSQNTGSAISAHGVRRKRTITALWIGDLWERATFMRRMEPILLDVALNPGFVEELLTHLAEYVLKTMEVLFSRYDFECIALSDDYGTQQSLIISPDDWRRLILPHLRNRPQAL